MPLPRLIELSSVSAYGFKILGHISSDFAGGVVSPAGDINGDGYADILFTARGNDSGGSTAGAYYVILGKAGGFGTIDLGSLSAADGFKIQGDAAGDGSTATPRVAAAGDINDDGYDDIIVSAPLNDAGGTNAGAAYLIFGKAGGFGPIDLTTLSGADGYKILGHGGELLGSTIKPYGDYNNDGFGDFTVYTAGAAGFAGTYLIYGKASGFTTIDLHSLSAADGFRLSNLEGTPAGDINGDGIEDMVIGRPLEGPLSNGFTAGAAYVLFGKVGGFGTIDLANLAPADGFRIGGGGLGAGSEGLGSSVAAGGDVNGDGYDDILIGAPTYNAGGPTGAAYVIFGKAGGFGPLDLTNLAPANGFRFLGEEHSLAGTSVSAAGDINHDGYDDILVGGASTSVNARGAAYIIFGRPEGFHNINAKSPGMDFTDGVVIRGFAPDDNAGISVAAAGDVNGDGVDDIIVGASTDDQGGGSSGAAYVIFGIAADLAHADAVATDEAHMLNGDLLADNGSGADANVDGGLVTVGAVNSLVANVGIEITLASGAHLIVNADGTFTYDPHGAFQSTPAPGSGASDTTHFDRFTYTLVGGSMGIVTISIAGIDNNDTLTGTPGIDNLFGGAGNDTIFGLGGDDQITGGTGADTMYGGLGGDFYYVDSAADVVNEAAGEGFDIIWSSVSYVLAAGTEVEGLSTRIWEATDAIDLTGNSIANTIHGNAGANRLDGGGGADALFGLEGNDWLTGGSGADQLYGGAGDDYYFIDNAADYAAEGAGQGFDIVWASAGYVLASGSEIEVLSTRIWEATDPIDLTGNELANAIYGNAGANSLDGGGGADTLFGFEGNDRLTGGSGVDQLYGGFGDDNYFVDSGSDGVFESAGQGFDIVWTTASYALATGVDVEVLSTRIWEATDAINLGGNEIANALYGNAGANALDGGGAADTLYGFEGNDSLNGGAGLDTLYGGAGDDFYFVDNAGDVVIETAPTGYDVVWASVSYTLTAGSQVEALSSRFWEDMSALDLAGNERDNTIYGNAGANLIDGGGGNDSLNGFGGADSYRFSTPLGFGNVDAIIGFAAVDDTILLDHNVFAALATGALNANAFVIGAGAADADDRIIYNSATGALYYDADGNGGGAAAVQFAVLQAAPVISASDFTVI